MLHMIIIIYVVVSWYFVVIVVSLWEAMYNMFASSGGQFTTYVLSISGT